MGGKIEECPPRKLIMVSDIDPRLRLEAIVGERGGWGDPEIEEGKQEANFVANMTHR